jgi:hypothetical protein
VKGLFIRTFCHRLDFYNNISLLAIYLCPFQLTVIICSNRVPVELLSDILLQSQEHEALPLHLVSTNESLHTVHNRVVLVRPENIPMDPVRSPQERFSSCHKGLICSQCTLVSKTMPGLPLYSFSVRSYASNRAPSLRTSRTVIG